MLDTLNPSTYTLAVVKKNVPRKVMRLRQLRRAAEMTQGQLAKRIGVEPNTINRYEKGHIRPSFDKGLEIARIFGLTAEEVFSYVEVPE